MEEETKGLTLKDVVKTIWREKWIALIVAVLITLIGAVTLFYGYNPSVSSYFMEFSLNLPGDDNSGTYIYPNGTQFYYADMTSYKTLRAVKASDSAFDKIDVDEMANKGHIHVRRDITVMVDANENISSYKEIRYTIDVKASYFANENQAKDFLVRLSTTPADYLSSIEIDYGAYLGMSSEADDYESEIGFLKNQLDVIEEQYDKLIETYGESFVVKEGKTILACAQEVRAYEQKRVLDNLLVKARENHYLKNLVDNKEKYRLQLIDLEKECKKAEETLNKMLSVNSDGSSTATVVLDANAIKAQADLVSDLNNEKAIIKNYYDNGVENSQFATNISEAYNAVKTFTDDFSETSATVYGKASSVVYIQPGIVAEEGGMGLLKIAILSIVVGVVVALIVAYVAGYYKNKNKKPVMERVATELPVQENPEEKVEIPSSENENK